MAPARYHPRAHLRRRTRSTGPHHLRVQPFASCSNELRAAMNAPGMSWLEVIEPGPLTTIQDAGRPGLGHLGVAPSGFSTRQPPGSRTGSSATRKRLLCSKRPAAVRPCDSTQPAPPDRGHRRTRSDSDRRCTSRPPCPALRSSQPKDRHRPGVRRPAHLPRGTRRYRHEAGARQPFDGPPQRTRVASTRRRPAPGHRESRGTQPRRRPHSRC